MRNIENLDDYFDTTPVVVLGRGDPHVIPGADSLSADAPPSYSEHPSDDVVVNPTLSSILAFIVAFTLYEPPWSLTAWLLARPTGADSYQWGLALGHSAYRIIVARLGPLPDALPTKEQFYQWLLRFANFLWATLAYLRSFLEGEQFYQWPLAVVNSYWFTLACFLRLFWRGTTYQEATTLGRSIWSAFAWVLSLLVRKLYYQWALAPGNSASFLALVASSSALVFSHSLYRWCGIPLCYLTYWWALALGNSIRRATAWLLSPLAQKVFEWALAFLYSAYI